MKRPDVPSMDEIEAIRKDINSMEHAIRELKNRLKELPAKIAMEIPNQAERIEAARYLYWMVQDISGTAIAEGLLEVGVHEMKRMIGTAIGMIQCDRCSMPMAFRSRTHLKEVIVNAEKGYTRYAEGYTVLCDPCWKDVQQIRQEKWKTHESKRNARLNQLRTMPYKEYLQTPEWQERRKQHLKSSGYRCQVCNSTGVVLNIHHRTYERRGQEYYKDLITLCESCHKLFHKEGRLATT